MRRHLSAEDLQELTERLWVERHLLERLEFKLEAAKLFLAADARRFVAPAIAEVELLVEHIQAAEPPRALAVAGAVRGCGVDPRHVTLGDLARRAPEPAAALLADHRDVMALLTCDVEALSTATRLMAQTALDRPSARVRALPADEVLVVRDAMARPDGNRSLALVEATLETWLEQAAYRSLIVTMRHVVPPSLKEFLGPIGG